MKIAYITKYWRGSSRTMIAAIDKIIEEYLADGFTLTVRQLYYQLVSRGLIPNNIKEYKKIVNLVSEGRRAGLLDWDAIVDRTRYLRKNPSWSSPQDIIESCAKQFRLDPWNDQPIYIEIWFEKDALVGVFERAAETYRVPLFSCRGYSSDSECWSAAQRFNSKKVPGMILHFGDHDPSGIDMTRDIEDRLSLFGSMPKIKRMALNMDQVRKYQPPPNPAKETDSRFADYRANYGEESWELDALDIPVIVKIVDQEVSKHVDKKKWDATLVKEEEMRMQLSAVSNNWEEIVKHL